MQVSGYGNLSNNPTIKSLPAKEGKEQGLRVCEFRMRLQTYARRRSNAPEWNSLSDEEKRADRQERDRGMWLNVSIWDERFIDAIYEKLTSGSPVYVDGDLEVRPYAREDGSQDIAYDLRAEMVLPWLPYVQSVEFKSAGQPS
jgi:single-stranded DNA-binding protein